MQKNIAQIRMHKRRSVSVRERSPMTKWKHCMIHREALVDETVEVNTKIINYVTTRPSKAREFQRLYADANAVDQSLLFYCSSRWLSLKKSFERVYKLVDEPKDFLLQENNNIAARLPESEFLLKLA